MLSAPTFPLQVLGSRAHFVGVPRRPVVVVRQPRDAGAASCGHDTYREPLGAVLLAQGEESGRQRDRRQVVNTRTLPPAVSEPVVPDVPPAASLSRCPRLSRSERPVRSGTTSCAPARRASHTSAWQSFVERSRASRHPSPAGLVHGDRLVHGRAPNLAVAAHRAGNARRGLVRGPPDFCLHPPHVAQVTSSAACVTAPLPVLSAASHRAWAHRAARCSGRRRRLERREARGLSDHRAAAQGAVDRVAVPGGLAGSPVAQDDPLAVRGAA